MVVNKPVTTVPIVVTQPRTRTPSLSTSGFSTTRFSPSPLVPTAGVNPFNDLSEGGKSSSLDRDREKDRNYGHNDRSPVISDPGHTDTNGGLSGSAGQGTSEDEDNHQVLPNVNGLGSKSVSNPVSNGVSNNAHSSDPEVNI